MLYINKVTKNKSFIIIKPDGMENAVYSKLHLFLNQRNIEIIGIEYFYFTNDLIDEFWPHRKKNNVSSLIMRKILQHRLSACIFVQGEFEKYESLTDLLASIKGSTLKKNVYLIQ